MNPENIKPEDVIVLCFVCDKEVDEVEISNVSEKSVEIIAKCHGDMDLRVIQVEDDELPLHDVAFDRNKLVEGSNEY